MKNIKNFLKKILHLLGYNLSINWNTRYQQLGKNSIYDSNTLKADDQERITVSQIKLYAKIINNLTKNDKLKNILDFGCGIGRHFTFLSNLNSVKKGSNIFGYDPTELLLSHASKQEYTKLYSSPEFSQKFDLIFCHMVLGGLQANQINKTIELMIGSLSKKGIIFLVEATGEENIEYNPWKIRKKDEYMPQDLGIIWTHEQNIQESGQYLSIIIGKRNREN